MKNDTRRITLISRDPRNEREYDTRRTAPSRLVIVDSFPMLSNAVVNRLSRFDVDLERIVIDRGASATDYLTLLAHLPQDFHGDVLYIRDDDSAFLSTNGRGGDRLVYALSATDLHFYLETHGLVTHTTPLRFSPALPLLDFSSRVHPQHAS